MSVEEAFPCGDQKLQSVSTSDNVVASSSDGATRNNSLTGDGVLGAIIPVVVVGLFSGMLGGSTIVGSGVAEVVCFGPSRFLCDRVFRGEKVGAIAGGKEGGRGSTDIGGGGSAFVLSADFDRSCLSGTREDVGGAVEDVMASCWRVTRGRATWELCSVAAVVVAAGMDGFCLAAAVRLRDDLPPSSCDCDATATGLRVGLTMPRRSDWSLSLRRAARTGRCSSKGGSGGRCFRVRSPRPIFLLQERYSKYRKKSILYCNFSNNQRWVVDQLVTFRPVGCRCDVPGADASFAPTLATRETPRFCPSPWSHGYGR